MNPARNDPCPCGSGKKFKKCCGSGADAIATQSPEARRAAGLKAAEQGLLDKLLRFARSQGGAGWLQEAMFDLGAGDMLSDDSVGIAIPWMLFHRPVDETGPPMARLFLDLRRQHLTGDEQLVMEAHLASWISLWQVTEVQPGVGERVEDLLTGSVRFIHDVSSSRMLRVHAVMLGAVVDCGGVSWFGGAHSRALGPGEADHVAGAFRRHFKLRARRAGIERLRNPEASATLIAIWDETVEDMDNAPPPRLTTVGGDPFELTSDRFDFDPGQRAAITRALEKLPDVIDFRVINGTFEVVVGEPGAVLKGQGAQRVIGHIEVRETSIVVETQSVRRADSLRRSLEGHLGPLVRFRHRKSKNVQAMLDDAGSKPPPRAAEMDAGLAAIALQLKMEHMKRWVDESIPALGGQTPRQASATRAGRARLETLLQQMEFDEGRLPVSERLDFSELRRTLGMH